MARFSLRSDSGKGDAKKLEATMRTVFRNTGLGLLLTSLLLGLAGLPSLHATAPVAGEGAAATQKLSTKQLEELVGRIALYPDDLLAILLPASTYPLDIVQADRFLQKLKKDPKLQPDPRWQESVRSLLNYPEVITMMSQDLDWTTALGEAVVAQQADVMKAVQQFRAKASAAGNLKTNDKQIIVQEKEVIKIVPANPEVIYVPQYQPTTVVVYQTAPAVVYYPTPYPVYYYPYPPGAAFATGFFFGAATAYAFNWGHQEINANVNINRTENLNVNRTNTQYQQSVQRAKMEGQQRAQQPATRQAGQQPQPRPGVPPTTQQASLGQGGGTKWQSQKRPGEVSGGRVSPGTAEARPGYGGVAQPRGDAFGDYGRGQDAVRNADRGMQSRGGGEFSGAGSRDGGFSGGGTSPGSGGGGRGGRGRRR